MTRIEIYEKAGEKFGLDANTVRRILTGRHAKQIGRGRYGKTLSEEQKEAVLQYAHSVGFRRPSTGKTSKVTLKDMAKEVGYTIHSCSIALRGDYGISEQTRKKILKAADKLSYTPNAASRGLRTGVNNLVAVVFRGLPSDFDQMLEAAARAHCELVVSQITGANPPRTVSNRIRTLGCKGALWIGVKPSSKADGTYAQESAAMKKLLELLSA